MGLQLVGETVDAPTAHRKARDGTLVQIFRGVYVGADDAADELLLEHGVRIAHYLYPDAYLCSASAIHLAPSADGRLFLSGRRNQRTRLRSLEIIQTKAPPRPSVDKAIVGDPLGEFTLRVSSPEQRLLEAFRLRSEQASALTEDLRKATADRLIAEYGSPEAAAEALWKLARANDWFREGEGAERYLRGAVRPHVPSLNRAAFSLIVAWHGASLGTLSHDGHEWRWSADPRARPQLVRETLPGTLPPFIESLLPEGWLAQVLSDEDERTMLRTGKRYMSNITIALDESELGRLPADILGGRLETFTRDGLFKGRYEGPDRGTLNQTFEANLARLFAAGTTPRLSGVQIKAPMFLEPGGVLRPATDEPFTHILKPAGTGGFEQMPVVEWLCLEIGRRAGFDVPDVALLEMPDGMPPALLVERFDIRAGPTDKRRLALEDFCSILGVSADDKYKGTIERAARALRGLSTEPRQDVATLFRRALFAWLIADGDMHLKNLAVLKIAGPEARAFESVRMAPLYDALTTRVFPGLAEDHMALKLAGKDDRLDLGDFATLARTIGIAAGEAKLLVEGLAAAVAEAAKGARIPQPVAQIASASAAAEQVLAIALSRAALLQKEIGASSA